MAAHARVAPSASKRTILCRGSLRLEAKAPPRNTSYARAGTARHELAAQILRGGHTYEQTKARADAFESIVVDGLCYPIREMLEDVWAYVEFVRSEAEGGTLLVEQRLRIGSKVLGPGSMTFLDYNPQTGLLEETTVDHDELIRGTGDALIFKNRRMKVIDAKFGFQAVEVEKNPQEMLYGIGALNEFEMLFDVDEVELIIFQPSQGAPSRWVTSVDYLHEFAQEFAQVVREALLDEEPELNPSEEACMFCDAGKAGMCPALKAETMMSTFGAVPATAADFEDLKPRDIGAMDAEELGRIMSKIGMIEDFCKGIRAEVERRLTANQEVPGFKIVQGRKGNRAWADENEAEKLLKSFRLKTDEMYDYKLTSPTKVEKILKDSPRRWSKVQALITRADGKPSVAPVDDPRPAISVTATVADFV